MMNPEPATRAFRVRAAVATALLALLALLPQLGAPPLSDPSEARYAEAAREMYMSGDWITPRINGLNHFTKPPLTYWLAASSYALCGGPGEFAARLPVALAAAAAAALTTLIGIELLGAPGAWAGLLLLGSAGFMVTARLLLTDMFLTFGVVLFYWVIARRLRDGLPLTRKDRLAIGLAAFLGFFAKGPIIFLWTVLPLAALAWRRPAWRGLIRQSLGWPYLAGLAATLFWFIAAMSRHDGLWRYFLFNQSVKAMTSSREFHPGPPGFYLPRLAVAAVCFAWPLAEYVRRRPGPPAAALLAAWILPPLLLLSLIPAKHETYILPLLPPLAVLGAGGLTGLPAWGRRLCLGAAAAILCATQLLLYLLFVMPADGHPRIARLQNLVDQKYLKDSVEMVERVAGPDGEVALVEHFTPSFYFYPGHQELLINPTIAGRFVNNEPAPQLRTDEDAALEEFWQRPRPVLVFLREQYMTFAARHPEASIAAEDGRFIVLTPKADAPRRRWNGLPAKSPPDPQP
jgi:4-amino-4-deoxy-L-arabinose transferase-like glycosyltransferase